MVRGPLQIKKVAFDNFNPHSNTCPATAYQDGHNILFKQRDIRRFYNYNTSLSKMLMSDIECTGLDRLRPQRSSYSHTHKNHGTWYVKNTYKNILAYNYYKHESSKRIISYVKLIYRNLDDKI